MMNAGNHCCELPSEAKDDDELEEVSASPVAAKQVSMGSAIVAVSSGLDGVFALMPGLILCENKTSSAYLSIIILNFLTPSLSPQDRDYGRL